MWSNAFTHTTSTACQMTVSFFGGQLNDKGENMKKEAIDVLIAGAVLYGVGTLYSAVLSFTGAHDLAIVGYGIVGYFTVRLTNHLRGK